MKILNILIVEDEIIIAETIKYYLEERGYNVFRIAISYDEAVQAYRLRCPDLVLLDIRLYDQKSGIDFANFLMSQSEAPPYIYLTSQYDQRILDEALKTNPSGYLTKPIQKETLWTTIEAAYQLHTSTNLINGIIQLYDGKKKSPNKTIRHPICTGRSCLFKNLHKKSQGDYNQKIIATFPSRISQPCIY